MFRTSNIRGQERFNRLWKSKLDRKGRIKLSPKQLTLIEKATILNLAEKVELLLVALGNKLATEMYMNVRYEYNLELNLEVPNEEDLKVIEKILDKLPFRYFRDSLLKKNKITNNNQNFVWYQVCLNEAVFVFMKEYSDDMTEFEEGILYGFPLSAIRSFARLIEARHDKPSPASYFLSGFCSVEFWNDEQDYYQLWWERLRKLSPKIVAQAEEEFYSKQR